MKPRRVNTHHNCDDFVVQTPLWRYTVKCFCGNKWEMQFKRQRPSREIVEYVAEECWTLDEDDHPQCPDCRRKIAQGLRPKDPTNLGSTQKDILLSLREHGSWSYRCGWLWDTPSLTKKVLDTLVRRDLVAEDKGVYTPK